MRLPLIVLLAVGITGGVVPPATAQTFNAPECLSTGAGTDRRFDWNRLDLQQRTEACARSRQQMRDDAQRLRPLLPPPATEPGSARALPPSLRPLPEPRPGLPPPGAPPPVASTCRAADCAVP
jgi:hypothetical protein